MTEASVSVGLLVATTLQTETYLFSFFLFSFSSDHWEKVAGYMAFYAVILFTFFALLLPWAVLMLGGNNPFLWLWNYLDNVHIRVRKLRKENCYSFTCFAKTL